MNSKSILKNLLSLTLFVSLLFQISSCSHVGHQNFQKQKFLKGKLKPVYSDNLQSDIRVTKADSLQSIESEILPKTTAKKTEVSKPQNEIESVEPESKTGLNSEDILAEPKKNQPKLPPVDEIKIKSPLPQLITPSKTPVSTGSEASFTWFVVLVCLGLIALPFAFLIGFWAFVISFVLLSAAGIILLTGDYDNPFLLLLVVLFFGLLCVAAVIALVWFIIWGIIQLVN